MSRFYYSDTIANFVNSSSQEIIGHLAEKSEFSVETTQRDAWLGQISILKPLLTSLNGSIFFEYNIPRMGRRIDTVLIIKNVIFVLEFKVGEKEFNQAAVDQVWDYALDLKNFHETSHKHLIAPILIATESKNSYSLIEETSHNDSLLFPIKTNSSNLEYIIQQVLDFANGEEINPASWSKGRYSPTPTIIEAAMSMFSKHGVQNIYRSDAAATNLTNTSNSVIKIINDAKKNSKKAICFITGVPGAGKTLVGLNIAALNYKEKEKSSTVYLSGNGPLVSILREALTRDKVNRERNKGNKVRKMDVLSEVKLIIQPIHHFRDECLEDKNPPFERVTIFDEAQRAWNLTQTADFMKRERNIKEFSQSEPEFLISCLDRHKDWAVIVCLVGGGQEINKGEAGISEWIESLNRSFPDWHIYVSNQLTDSEYAAGHAIELLEKHKTVFKVDTLHLSVSMRSFRSEHVALLVKNILDLNIEEAKKSYQAVKERYPIVITRDLSKAKHWLKSKARGTERYGLIVSSKAARLKPDGIDVKSPMNPVNWFLEGKDDIQSSYFLEDVATEFDVQGLELDWTCVNWDADFRYEPEGWRHFELRFYSEKPTKWIDVKKDYRQQYLKNAYRVLLTRARQGMIVVVPVGDDNDATRSPAFYDGTFNYLREVGFEVI